jgi:group I intron endonuclease
MIVYKATNEDNGMQYVGVTVKKLNYRANGHKRDADRGRGSENSLQNAIRVHGFSKITFEQIDEADNYSELREKEMFWIKKLNTRWPNGYNLNKGGNLHGEIKNKTYRHKFTIDGVTYEGMENLAKAFGLTKKTVESRLTSNLNWTLRQIVGLDPAPVQVPVCAKEITYKGVTYPSKRHLVRALNPNMNTETFRHRLERGMSIEDALSDKKLKGNAAEVVVGGKTFRSICAAARYYGISSATMGNRIRAGWSSDDCASQEIRGGNITAFGITYKNKMELCERLGLNYELFCQRLWRSLTPEQAINNEKTKYEKGLEFTVDGKTFDTKKEAAEYYGMIPRMLIKRLYLGWTPEEAVGLVKRGKIRNPGREVKVEGRTFKSIRLAAEHYGISSYLATSRFNMGWEPEEVFGLKERSKRRPHKGNRITVEGVEFPSLLEAADHYGLHPACVRSRIKDLGWTIEQAFGIEPKPERVYNRCPDTGRLLKNV